MKLEDSAYISNPGVTADSLGLSSRLLLAESKANMSFKQVNDHKKDKNNPHGVTAAQVGAYSTVEVNGYVTALYNEIAENKSGLESKLGAMQDTTQAAFDKVGKVVAGKAEANHSHTASDVGAYTTEETDSLLEGKAEANHSHTASDVGAYTTEETDSLLENKADSNSVYTMKQTDTLLSKPYYYKDVKLTDVVSVEGVGTVEDNVLSTTSGRSVFKFNITGKVKFSCKEGNVTFSLDDLRPMSSINVDGQTVDHISSMLEQTYTFDVKQSLEIVAERCDIIFSEFSIGVYVKDSIAELESGLGDIDTALDAILAIQRETVGDNL